MYVSAVFSSLIQSLRLHPLRTATLHGGEQQPTLLKKLTCTVDRVHAKGVVLCERACFCLLSAF